MRALSLISLFFVASILSAQDDPLEERYYFHLTIDDPGSLEITAEDGQVGVVNPSDPKESSIYKAYRIYEFEPAFPGTRLEDLKKVYRVVTNRVELLGTLWKKYPEKYTKIDQFYPGEGPYYPNDYGTTSPVANLGAKQPLYDLDLINAPGAWGISTGSKKVVIGISDAKVDSTNADLKDRVSSYLRYFDKDRGLNCSHGTNVAGIAIARMNNAFGRPGMCSDCDVITTGYGDFKYIEELVAAGARVINTSWARCGMGAYHEQIEQRINELYEQGILIVAGAGNAKNCNRDGFPPDDYAYPASYEKVISVTGVFSKNERLEDSVFIDVDGYRTTARLKDRHSMYHALPKNGSVIPKYLTKNMQYNKAIDICAPAHSYLLGSADCNVTTIYGGATSSTAPYITGTIGLMWSVNYCLDAYETESILKLSSTSIEQLPGNEPYFGMLGAGRVDAYKAVKMARDMKELMGTVEVSGRDFYRFDFRLRNAPYNIRIENQTFRDSSTVDFRARNSISLKPGTRLAPDENGSVKLAIDPELPTAECLPNPPKNYVGLIETLEKQKEIERSKIKPRFEVSYKNSIRAILVHVIGSDELNGRTYNVKVLSPKNVLLGQERFSYPDDGLIAFDYGEELYVKIIITINGVEETYNLKRSR